VSDIKKLLPLQDLDCRLRGLKRELEDIPKRKEEEQARLAEHKANLAAAEEAMKHEQARIRELEIEAQSCRDKITKYRQQQMVLKSNKEFQAMETEIASVLAAIRGHEDKELVLMEDVEAARGNVAERRKELKAEEEAVGLDVAELDVRLKALEAEIASLEPGRAAVRDDVPKEMLARYERILQRRDRAVVPVEGGICGGCHMKLPPSVNQNILKQEALVACDHCGRLLYLA
jgi:predicted  nucleic acid-binding Zn-ribbon protein